MMLKRNTGNIAIAIFLLFTFLAKSQAEETQDLSAWNYDKLYQEGGFTAQNLMEVGIFGANNNEIGDVENVLLNEQNKIIAIISQVGETWEARDTRILIPWDEVELTKSGLATKISEGKVSDYRLFESQYLTKEEVKKTQQVEDKISMSPSLWKLSDILNEFTNVEEGHGYGYVDDVLFSRSGVVQAIVIDAAINGDTKTYAFPFTGIGEGWAPGLISYTLPYTDTDLYETPAFEYEKYDGVWD